MKRIAFLILLSIAACDDDPAAVKHQPASWNCADFAPSRSWSWDVDPVLDTLMTLTVQVTYPDGPCEPATAWVRWSDKNGISFFNDFDPWERLPNGRLEASSSLRRTEAGARDSLYITWGIWPDIGAGNDCKAFVDSLLDCGVNFDTLTVRELLP